MTTPPVSELPAPPPGRQGWPWTAGGDGDEGGPGLDSARSPIVAVVTPSLNQGRFLEETIRSVVLQNYPGLRYVIKDGGSTDETVSIIERYESWITDWSSAPDGGQSAAINAGFRGAEVDYVAWLNSDDVYEPGALAGSVAALERTPEAGFSYGDWSTIDESGGMTGEFSAREPTMLGLLESLQSYVCQPTVVFRRSALDRVGLLDPDLHVVMDYDLLLRLTASFPAVRAPGRLARFRVHSAAKTGLGVTDREMEERRALMPAIIGRADLPADVTAARRRLLANHHRHAALYYWSSGRPAQAAGHALRSLSLHPAQVTSPGLWSRLLGLGSS